ncbi:MAG: hypothetical protein R2912_03490 [Eubacteriales bacterium]
MNKKRSPVWSWYRANGRAMQTQLGSSYCAVYSFAIDGKTPQYVSNYAGTSNLLVGQSVEVYYDPNNIGRVYIEEDARQMKSFTRVFIILGGVFTSVALIVAVVLKASFKRTPFFRR